jgi:hypothetical protein
MRSVLYGCYQKILEAILTQSKRHVLSYFLVALLLAPFAFAKEDGHELLSKSFQQGDIWTQGPVKLVAQVRLPRPGGADINVTYTISWAGPDKWVAEWSAQGLKQDTVLNSGKLSFFSNQPSPLLWGILFESALAGQDGGNPAGPYSVPPTDWQKAKLDTSKKKVGTVDAKCMTFGQPAETLCIDPATAHMLSVDVDFTTFEYADYVTVGSNSYPQTVKVSFNKQLLVEGKVTVTRGDKFADALFTPPDKSTTVDYPSCADVDKNFTAPHLNKSVPPKMPDAAKKAKKYGVVWVVANVGKDGSVTKASVIGGDPDLTAAAADAVQQYKYAPYMRCGQGVEFQKLVVVPFLPPAALPEEPSPTK